MITRILRPSIARCVVHATLVLLSFLLLSSLAQPLARNHAALTPSVALACSPTLCETTAIVGPGDPPVITIICLNSCQWGCSTYSTPFPGGGSGSSCKCKSSQAGTPCCHLVIGFDANGTLHMSADGGCGGGCPGAGACGLIIEYVEEDTINVSTDCQ